MGQPAVAVAASPGEVGGARAVVSLRTLLGNAGAQVLGRPITVGGIARLLDAGAVDEVVEQVAEALAEASATATCAA